MKFEGFQVHKIDVNSAFSYFFTIYNREMAFEVNGEIEERNYLSIGNEESLITGLFYDNDNIQCLFILHIPILISIIF